MNETTITTWADREPGLADGGHHAITTARPVTVDGFAYTTTAPPRRVSTTLAHYSAEWHNAQDETARN